MNEIGAYHRLLKAIEEGAAEPPALEDLQALLELLPENPHVLRAYGDALMARGSTEAAVTAYIEASDRFMTAGKGLQAIVARILAWGHVKPTHAEGRAFHTRFREDASGSSPLQNFFARLSYPELVAVMLRLTRVRLPADETIVRFGESARELFFIVSGTVNELAYHALKDTFQQYKTSNHPLSASDVFGDILPLEHPTSSRADVTTLTPVELVKLSKSALQEICVKFPNLQPQIAQLYKSPDQSRRQRSWQTVRRHQRHAVPAKVILQIIGEKDESLSPTLEGFTRDISLGGAYVELDPAAWAGSTTDLIGKTVRFQIDLPSSDTLLEIAGIVVWCREGEAAEGNALAVGLMFEGLSNRQRALIEACCIGSDGEQNLIWSLWKSILK